MSLDAAVLAPVPVRTRATARPAPEPTAAGGRARTGGDRSRLSVVTQPIEPVPGSRPATVMAFGAQQVEFADRDFGPTHTPVTQLPDPAAFAAQLTRHVLEVMACVRPMPSLIRWLDVDVYQALSRRVALLGRTTGRSQVRALIRVQSARACVVDENIAEVTLVVREGARVRAVAMRLEGLDQRWRVTALEIG